MKILLTLLAFTCITDSDHDQNEEFFFLDTKNELHRQWSTDKRILKLNSNLGISGINNRKSDLWNYFSKIGSGNHCSIFHIAKRSTCVLTCYDEEDHFDKNSVLRTWRTDFLSSIRNQIEALGL